MKNSNGVNLESTITIFTDGSSRGNPGQGGFGAVIVYNDGELKVSSGKFQVKETGGREEHTTNNRMELRATISALSFVSTLNPKPYTLLVYSDSSYVINGITKWVYGWQKNNWTTSQKKPVENRDLWEKLISSTIYRTIEWKQVGGHVGVAGNDRCDQIATEFADGFSPKLYSGHFENYPIKNILDIKENDLASMAKSSSKSHAKAKAYSYVSSVEGKVLTHKTWGECEQRVKGKSGAKYKKSLSAENEKEIIAKWS